MSSSHYIESKSVLLTLYSDHTIFWGTRFRPRSGDVGPRSRGWCEVACLCRRRPVVSGLCCAWSTAVYWKRPKFAGHTISIPFMLNSSRRNRGADNRPPRPRGVPRQLSRQARNPRDGPRCSSSSLRSCNTPQCAPRDVGRTKNRRFMIRKKKERRQNSK